MGAGTFSRSAAIALCAMLMSHALAQDTPAQPPVVAPLPPVRMQIPPGGGPLRTGPGGVITSPDAAGVEPAASAAFEPAEGSVGRPMEYRVIITGGQRMLELPPPEMPEGLAIQPGGRSFSLTPLNGQLVHSSTFRFAVTAVRPGEYVIPAFTVDAGGRNVRVPSARVVVREAQEGEEAYQPVRAFIEVPQREFFIGETIKGRVLIPETPDEIPQYVQHVAKTSGAVLFKPSMRTRREQFTLDGRQRTGLAMPVEITPILAGESSVNCEIIVHVARTGGLGRQTGFTSQATLNTPDVKVRARVVPEIGRPPGFTGAIGKFTLSQPKLSASEIEVGEPLILSVSLRGTGNLDSVPPPEMPEGSGWTMYRPTSELEFDPDGETGTKTFSFTLVPRQEGRKGTPHLPFAYFDPEKALFVDISVPPMPVVVKPSPNPPVSPVDTVDAAASAPREPPREARPALTGLAEHPGTWSRPSGGMMETFLRVQAVPALLILGIWLWRKRREHLARHPEILRRRRARAAARRALSEARSAARRGDHAAFLKAGVGALCEAAAPLDTAEARSLTREEVLAMLRDDEQAAAAARAIFENADAARYAAGAPAAGALELLPQIEQAVNRLEARA